MTKKFTVLVLLCQFFCQAQVPSANSETEYYRNGQLKTLFTKKGKDTIEIKKYYKSGRLRDSIWVYLTDKDEIPLGVSKSYHENGQLALLTRYIRGNEQYITYEYNPNGRLKRFEERPTGLTKMYNRKGEQIVEYDYHKLKDVDVPVRFRNVKRLENSRFGKRITSSKASIVNASGEKEMMAGSLITLQLLNDTVKRAHCLMEGFSKDTLFISDFHYNEDFQPGTDVDILKYDSSFALPISKVSSVKYARQKTKKRIKAAQICTLVGAELILIPIIPCAVLPFIGYEVMAAVKLYAVFAVPGTGIFFLGKHFFRTAVPKHYDLKEYRIIVKD